MALPGSSDPERAWAQPESGDEGTTGWVMPETPAAQPQSPTVAGADRAFREGRSERAAADAVPAGYRAGPRVPVPLKPMTMSDILDGSWRIMKTRPKTVLGLSAILVLPPQVLFAFLERQVSQETYSYLGDFIDSAGTAGPSTRQSGAILLGYVIIALQALSLYFLGAAIGRLVSAWYAGGDLTIGQALGAAFRKTHVILADYVVVSILTGLSLLCLYIGAIFVIPLFLLVAPIITIENAGPIAALQRSWKLVSRRLFPVMLIWAMTALVEFLVRTAIETGPSIIAAFGGGALEDVLVPIASAVGRFVVAPFSCGVAVLIYLDLRVRPEGLDLELEASDAFVKAA